ncbi:MAG: hypothetical protein V5A68_05230 [Candidatus Thermoplasmatota archaeon]
MGAYSGSKPYLDITEISYTISDSEVTLKMVLDGNPQVSSSVRYHMYIE